MEIPIDCEELMDLNQIDNNRKAKRVSHLNQIRLVARILKRLTSNALFEKIQ